MVEDVVRNIFDVVVTEEDDVRNIFDGYVGIVVVCFFSNFVEGV